MGAAAASSYTTNFMFAQAPFFRANVAEKQKLRRRIVDRGDKGVAKDGSKYYYKGTLDVAHGFAGKPFSSETMARPTAYPATLALPSWTCKDYWIPLQITGKLASQGDLISMLDYRSVYMQAIKDDIAWFQEYNLAGYSTGQICKVSGAGSGYTFTVDNPAPLRIGNRIDVHSATSGGSQLLDSGTISAVNYKTGVVTTDVSATSVTVGSYVFNEDSRGYMGDGLLDLINDGSAHIIGGIEVSKAVTSYAGLTKSSYPQQWNSYIEEVSTLTDKTWNGYLANAVDFYHGDDIPWNECWVNPKTFAFMKSVLAPNFRTMSATDNTIRQGAVDVQLWAPEATVGSFKPVSIPWIPPNCAVFVTTSDLGIRYPFEPNWRRMLNGEILHENTNDSTGYFQFTGSFIGIETLIGHPHMHSMLCFDASLT